MKIRKFEIKFGNPGLLEKPQNYPRNNFKIISFTFLQKIAAKALTKRTEKIPMRKVQTEDRRKHHHFLVWRHSTSPVSSSNIWTASSSIT